MQITEIGETHLVLSVPGRETADCVREVWKLFAFIQSLKYPEVSSIRCGLDCLLLEYGPEFDTEQFSKLIQKTKRNKSRKTQQRPIRVPVCFQEPYNRDLSSVMQLTRLGSDEIIQSLTSRIYEVWMIGFMPGYPYIGGLQQKLRVERKASPDPHIPAGSVAIADEYIGIYPFDSPGGWHILGKTPLTIIDYSRTPPSLFESRMQVEFYAISADEFAAMKS